jgi:hypothetical protein
MRQLREVDRVREHIIRGVFRPECSSKKRQSFEIASDLTDEKQERAIDRNGLTSAALVHPIDVVDVDAETPPSGRCR